MIETIVGSLKELLGATVKAIPGILAAIIILFLTRYAVQLIQNIVDNAGSRAIRSVSLRLLLRKTTRVAIWVVGIVLACLVAFPGFKLGDVIATLGLGSVAIGFAFQDIFKNFLAGIILLIEEPFSIGDEIHTSNFKGKVENISIRTTQIRTYEGQKVLLPNSTVFTDAVEVVTAYPARRTNLAVGVDYNTSLTEASNILEKLIARVEGVLDDPAPEIDLVNFNDSSIDFVVRYWTKPQQKIVRHVQTRAIVAIKKAFDDADINIPYPIRTLYYYDQEKYSDYIPNENRSANS